MSDLIAVVYPDVSTAGEVRQTLARLQKEHLIELEDAVAVVKESDGNVHLDQSIPSPRSARPVARHGAGCGAR